MQIAIHPHATAAVAHAPPSRVPQRGGHGKLEPLHPKHPQRAACERFIAARFRRAHDARIEHFSAYLLGVRDALGRWRAAAGYTPAERHVLFLEQYLDAPIEASLSRCHGEPVEREAVAEVGNLAAASTGMARALIPMLARHLHRLGYEWVVFTATRELRNSFARLGLQPIALASADPGRLEGRASEWGRYYANDPVVMAGRIAHGVRDPLPA